MFFFFVFFGLGTSFVGLLFCFVCLFVLLRENWPGRIIMLRVVRRVVQAHHLSHRNTHFCARPQQFKSDSLVLGSFRQNRATAITLFIR